MNPSTTVVHDEYVLTYWSHIDSTSYNLTRIHAIAQQNELQYFTFARHQFPLKLILLPKARGHLADDVTKHLIADILLEVNFVHPGGQVEIYALSVWSRLK